MQEYNICYSLDSAYLEQLEVSVVSIIKNSAAEDIINFYILDGGLTDEDKTEIELLKNIKNFNIEYINVDNKDFLNCPLLSEKSKEFKNYHVTVPTYYRFKLPEFLQEQNKILYLDCDVIVRSSLKELYNTDLTDKAAAMILDAETKKNSARLNLNDYYNAGVMLINLEYWRANNIEAKLFDFALKHKDIILWQDQDIINCILREKIKKLNDIWNYQYFLYDNIERISLSDCRILHLAGRFKPWIFAFEHFVYDEYYYYLSFTKHSGKIIEYKMQAKGKHLKNNIGGNSANILLTATDEDIQNVYNAITENYRYTENLVENSVKDIPKLYDEISKNYKYTENLVEDSRKDISKIYDEISKNYKYTESLVENSAKNISEKCDEVSENYKYIQNLAENSNNEIPKLYDEISRKFKYVEELTENNDKNYRNEIQKLNEYTDKKIAELLNEIFQKYVYLKELSENNLKISQEEIQELTKKTNEKIKEVEEIFNKKNYETSLETLQKTFNRIDNLKNEFYEKFLNLSDEIKQKNDLKYSEIYSYTNEHISGLFNEIKNTSLRVENTINDKILDLYKKDDFIINKINLTENKLNSKIDNDILKVLTEKIKQEIAQRDLKYSENINHLQNEFNEQLNNQRIKYEKKLITMENQIKQINSYMKKNIFIKLLEKLKIKKREK